MSSQAAADPAVLAAAKQVKALQNSGPSGLKQWSEYVKTFADAKDGSFNFSPDSYSDAEFLVDFVSNYNDGYRLSSVGAAVAEGADLEESGVFKGALDDHLRAEKGPTHITAMSENVAGEFLKLCGQLCLKGSGAIPAKKKAKAASVSSSASEVAQQVSGVQNSGPSGAKQWALYLQSFDEGNSPSGSPEDFDDDFLRDFLDNFNDGYRLKSVSAAAAECAQLESSGTFAKAMEHFLRSKKQNAEIHSVADETASEFFKTCGKLVSQSHAEEVIEPETPQAKTPPSPPPPPFSPSAQKLQSPPLPPVPTTEPKNSKKSDKSAKEKVVAPLKSSATQQVKAADASRPPPKKAPAPSKGSAWAPKPTLEPQALDAKMKLNDWIHSRLKRKPTLEDVMFGFRFEEVGGKQRYGAELVFMNKELAPSGTVVYEGTPQVTKKDAMDSAAYKALVELKVQL